ncbi:DUF4214 domain-containing protein [Acidithiobacillus thiooxidans]|uniref:DUF4214 domain-containing protein n=1 Tax=Acidithiobacillus thiooxidans TaxID=930 RepID=A0A1C2IQI0_ACITH|nr:DUF4214 domain-containing protein [Acidithiobacillus thiooxidans]OCX75580.1 hypothetical protein A6M23_02195 [Acidithiobacillus thiooxidans]OCX78230.1 hypothetical protein A6P08_20160 [Acidithiobacillus thiooxidans]
MPADTNPPRHNLHTAPNLRDLLALPHETFLPVAFTALLGREPDVVGLIHYALRLQGGASRVLILAEIRTSPEGQRHAPYATSDELELVVRRYQIIRGLPLGRRRWNLLPQFGREPPSGNFDWERWASDYVGQKKQAAELTAPTSESFFSTSSEKKISEESFAALEQRVEALFITLQQALSLMQAQGISTQSVTGPQRADTPPQGYLTITTGEEVSWAARSAYVQLCQRMNAS